MFLHTRLLVLAALVLAPSLAHAAKSYDNCTGFIDSLPATITTQGTWCLRQDLATGLTQGAAIAVATNNVTLDCNDFKLGNLSAGTGTQAYGVRNGQAINVAIRNCKFRGFETAVYLSAPEIVGNYRVERNSVQGATVRGIYVSGSGSVIRGNTLIDIGGTTAHADAGALGISTAQVVDIVDNAVSGVAGDASAVGIFVYHNTGGSIRGNRVRNVIALDAKPTMGILASASGRAVIRGNDVSAVGGDSGLYCGGDTSVRALDNNIIGFAVGIDGCGNAGGNAVAP